MRSIKTGDVVALAVDGVHNLPPAGRVGECDDDAIVLYLYKFADKEMLIRRRDIRATVWADAPVDDSQLAATMDALVLTLRADTWRRSA